MTKNTNHTTKPFYKKAWFWIIAIIVSVGLGSASGNSSNNSSSNETTSSVSSSKPNVPADYTSALKAAKNYSDTMHMSKRGIYNQLTSDAGDKFSPEAAQYAVDHVNANWYQNALKAAKSYQDDMAMSPDAIRDQLTSDAGDKFTPEEADYAIQHLND